MSDLEGRGAGEGRVETRRGLLAAIAVACHACAAAIVAVPAIRFLLGPLGRAASSGWVRIGHVRDLSGPEPRAARFACESASGYAREERVGTVWVTRAQDGVVVLSSVCTHMGCNVSWSSADRAFVCPCHGGRYDLEGRVIAGPPPRPLRRHAARVEDGQLWIEVVEGET